ncbi:MAG TPA: crossover junction endodeoxyribonuclease RuvC [Spirochaetota bacterium]|nr:crossover junction endodeoxyribonuclease RuvC [Spirochaetota bacterium]
MRILGIDPGFGILGWAVIEHTLSVVACGSIETSPSMRIDERLVEIHRSLGEIITTYTPDCAAVERLFFSKNTTTALDVSKAIGVILLTIRLGGLDYFEYTPLQVKQALTGYGRATKEQVEMMMMKILRLKTAPVCDDVADALSIAACHSFSLKSPAVSGRGPR